MRGTIKERLPSRQRMLRPYHRGPPRPSLLLKRGSHDRADAAADVELAGDGDAAGGDGLHDVVEDDVGHVLVEVPLVAERPEVELERLQLDALLVGHIADRE